MKKSIIVSICLLICFQTAQAADMNAPIEQEVGIVCKQLTEYTWQTNNELLAIPENALKDFKFWVNATVAKPYQITEMVAPDFHHETNGTCDAIRIKYSFGDLAFTIIQTRQTMLISIKGNETALTNLNSADIVASRISSRVFEWPATASPVLMRVSSGLAFGKIEKNDPNAERIVKWPADGRFKGGFVPYRWWADGHEIHFFGAKMPFNSTAPFIMNNVTNLQTNHKWF